MELLTISFIQRAIIAGILAAITAGLLGIFVILRRSSFFGDAIAHASLAGIALGIFLNFDPLLCAAVLAVIISIFLFKIEKKEVLTVDTLLGFTLPFFMALGVLILNLIPGYQPELISFLFGNILAISQSNLVLIVVISLIVFAFIYYFRQQLILVTFDIDQARLSGINVDRILLFYYILLALTIVIGIKSVGIVLVNALLVIPAATAKVIAHSLEQMFVLTLIFAIIGVVVGLFASYFLNIPSGAAIVIYTGLQFILTLLIKRLMGY